MGRRQRRLRCMELLEQFNIKDIRKTRAAKVSGGERRRLEIARCLISEPLIILLDEPFAGIDPVTVQMIQEIIRDLKRRGIAVLITDHAAREILEVVDRCYVIYEGKVKREGPPDAIRNDEEVKRIYLGNMPGREEPPTSPTRRFLHGRERAPGKPPSRRFRSIHDQETLDAGE